MAIALAILQAVAALAGLLRQFLDMKESADDRQAGRDETSANGPGRKGISASKPLAVIDQRLGNRGVVIDYTISSETSSRSVRSLGAALRFLSRSKTMWRR